MQLKGISLFSQCCRDPLPVRWMSMSMAVSPLRPPWLSARGLRLLSSEWGLLSREQCSTLECDYNPISRISQCNARSICKASAGSEQREHLPPPPLQRKLVPPVLVLGSDGQLQLTSRPDSAVTESATNVPEQKSTRNKAGSATGREGKEQKTPKPQKIVTKQTAKRQAPPKYSKGARRFYNERFRESERLSKVLASVGIASRRTCEEMIFAGRVTVNGTVCTVPQTQVDLVRDSIYVDGRSLPKKLPPKLYFAVNKPKGYICSSCADGKEGKTAISLVDEYMKVWRHRNAGIPEPRLFTVGRLDVATTGLLLITNDGNFAQGVAHPSSDVTKE